MSCALTYISQYKLHAKYWVESHPSIIASVCRVVVMSNTLVDMHSEDRWENASQCLFDHIQYGLVVMLTFDLLTSESKQQKRKFCEIPTSSL